MLKDLTGGIGAFCKIDIMAEPETDAQLHLTGIKKYFNSYTVTGRMNCVLEALLDGLILQVKV